MSNRISRFRRARNVLWWESRPVTDTISWFVFYLLTVGFSTILLWFQYDTKAEGKDYATFLEFIKRQQIQGDEMIAWIDAFNVILRNSLVYTLIMMLPMYLNVVVFKKHLLDSKVPSWWRNSFYLLAVILNALFFAGALHILLKVYPELLRVKMSFPLNLLTILGVQVISTGMLYRREIVQLSRRLRRVENRIKNTKVQLESALEKGMVEVSGNKNHLKIGKKNSFDIVPFADILYLQGDGNEPRIFTINNLKKGKIGSSRMLDYEDLLPSDTFIRVHRRFIINKTKVRKRDGKYLYLEGVEEPIPIGGTYEETVEKDDFLGFETANSQNPPKIHPENTSVHQE